MKSYSIQELSKEISGTIYGYSTYKIKGVEQLDKAETTDISFIRNKKYEKQWQKSKACVAVVSEDISIQPEENRAFIKVSNVDLAMSQILKLFAPSMPVFYDDIHINAAIDESAVIGQGVRIGAGSYIGRKVTLGENVIIYPNVTILDECIVGENTVIWPGVVIRERCQIGSDCIVHSNVTIGADGFGFHSNEKGLVKIPQIGNVIIGNDVEIGANSCIDRGKFSSTIIGNGCKIDNLVQIGHNCKLGDFCIIAGHSGLAGSVTLGSRVIIGGAVGVKDNITVGDGVIIGVGSIVIKDISAGKRMVGYPAAEVNNALKQWAILKNFALKKN